MALLDSGMGGFWEKYEQAVRGGYNQNPLYMCM